MEPDAPSPQETVTGSQESKLTNTPICKVDPIGIVPPSEMNCLLPSGAVYVFNATSADACAGTTTITDATRTIAAVSSSMRERSRCNATFPGSLALSQAQWEAAVVFRAWQQRSRSILALVPSIVRSSTLSAQPVQLPRKPSYSSDLVEDVPLGWVSIGKTDLQV